MPTKDKWTLSGFDSYDNTSYPLEGEFDTQKEAEEAGAKILAELQAVREAHYRPDEFKVPGARDWVFVIAPWGERFRV